MFRQNQSPLTLTYINIRKIVGVLAMSLPLVVFLVEKTLFHKELQPSISAYYYTEIRWYFVFTLFCIGFFLFFYQGYDNLDKWLARIAGIGAFLTAFFPTSNPNSIYCASPLLTFNPTIELLSETYLKLCSATATIHLLSAGTMFVTVAFFSLFRFTKGESETKEKKRRNFFYILFGLVIVISVILMVLFSLEVVHLIEKTVYWGEFVALIAFGASWAIKGEWLWMNDSVPSSNSERFNKLQRRQVDGYKSGLGVFVFLVAIWLTLLLYSAEIFPFSLFMNEPEQGANVSAVFGFERTEAQGILMGILFVMVVIVFYFILNNQVLSLFWPLVRRNFRVELGDDETGEKAALWTLFTNQINEMELQPRFSVNPRADSGIAAPSTLTPDSSYLKTFLDLVNWIFPQLGYVLRLNKMTSSTLGEGLSLAVVKNDRKETVAETILWASIYRLHNNKEGEGKDDEQEGDLSVYRLLMIPAYFWFADVVDRLDGFMPAPQTWEAMSYYYLGNSLWHSNIEKGINFYSNCINLDSQNWPAYAALGRVWIERSQDEATEEFKREYLLLANNYLNTAINGLRNTKKLDEVYFGALYNQIVVLFYLLCPELSLEKVLLMGYMVRKESLSTLKIIQQSLVQRKANFNVEHASLWADGEYDHYTDVLKEGNSERLNSALLSIKGIDGLCDKEMSDIRELIDNKKITQEELQNHSMANWLINFLHALEFVLLILELENMEIGSKDEIEIWLDETISAFIDLPCCGDPVDMNKPLLPQENPDKGRRHFTRSHYRVQYNAACFYSELASKAKASKEKNKPIEYAEYVDLALDHLEMALSVGGGLVKFAQKDSALNAIKDEKRFKNIVKAERNTSKIETGKKGEDRSVYQRETDGKWVHKRINARRASKGYDTQKEAIAAAQQMLQKQGGGELIIQIESG